MLNIRATPRLRSSAAFMAFCLLAPGTARADEAPVENGASQVSVTLTGDDGGTCVLDHDSATAGPVTFRVANETATAISEVELLSDNRILGEKENLAPGLPPVSFTVTLGGGGYQIYCPGAAEETVAFTVTGQATQASSELSDILAEGAEGYSNYVSGIVDGMVTAVAELRARIDTGDMAGSRLQYAVARTFYERIESDVEGFVMPGFDLTDNAGNLDYLIDMRASNLDPAVGWHGFHAIERDLFDKGAIDADTKTLAAELDANVRKLVEVAGELEFLPEDLANGAAALLEEVQSGKITGEEEAYSHIDLVDFAANIEGAEQAFAFLAPGMRVIDPELTVRVEERFAAVKTMLEDYRDETKLGGYVLYTPELRASDAPKLSRAIQALQEPFAQIAEKVATAR